MVQPREEHGGSCQAKKSGQILHVPGRQSSQDLGTSWMQDTREQRKL